VHDLVDFVSEEGEIAGKSAALYAQNKLTANYHFFAVRPGQGLRTIVPQQIRVSAEKEPIELFMRVRKTEKQIILNVKSGAELLLTRKMLIVKPGEMIVVKIPIDKLADMREEINVSLEQQGAKV
ncbi:hypothetical protein Ga0466249_005016, partial [Sporomusaceae bacterium BoRhaA]|nr:hypothetical protein [Pelorhabdus rhamnosifermentans]